MIRMDGVTFTYADRDRPVLRDVELEIDEGELCLVIGGTGAGKSTLLGTINGLVPHFTGGHLDGSVTVDGRETRDYEPRDLADAVGYVGQDPLSGFVTDTVEEELAYGMEQLGLAPAVMRKRVEETLDLLGIADLRARALRTLSGGQQQRVAIGSVLTAHPRTLVLDEPTSALDPTAAEDVLATLARLVHDLGVTVVVAEHRLERVAHHADRVVYVRGDGRVDAGAPDVVLGAAPIAPPVVHLARLARWERIPLSVRDARRLVAPLRAELAGRPRPPRRSVVSAVPALRARGIVVRYGPVVAVRAVDLDLHPGEITALMGRNGSGKSSLLWSIQGSGARERGSVDVGGDDPHRLASKEARTRVGLVPQTPGDLLYLTSVAVARLVGPIDAEQHPHDLSEGQRLSLVLAIQLAASPPVLLLDEPTRGLDPTAKDRFAEIVDELAATGTAVAIATHDVELVAHVADRVVVLGEGEIVADGPTDEVVCSSPAFAPQIAKILDPEAWLTVAEIAGALGMAS
jgi:energy-coupling factor transport system ATP-binding protein